MSSLGQSDFHIRPEDKGCNFFTQTLEDPFDDIFDQYVNLDSSESSDFFHEPRHSNLSGESEFAFEADTASNGSYTVRPSPTNIRPANPAQSHEPWRSHLLWPTRHTVASSCQSREFRADRARSIRAAIPGTELLNLEGKSNLGASAFIDPSSPPFTPPSTPSQRIAKPATANVKTIRRRDRISKSPGRTNSKSSKMMSPSYYHRQETPSYQEWTQRFEQINLQALANNSMLSPPPSARVSQQENPAGIWESQRKSLFEFSDPPEIDDKALAAVYRYRMSNIGSGFGSCSPTLVSREKRMRRHARTPSVKDVYSSPIASPQPRRSVSWMQPTAAPSQFEYTPPLDGQQAWIGTVQVQQPWYNTAQLSEQYVPQTFQNVNSDFATQGLMIQCGEPYSPFLAEDSSDDYFTTTSSNPYQASIAAEVFPSALYPATKPLHHQRTPSLSSSPSPPMSKSRRSSKSANHSRRKSSGTGPTTPKTPNTALGFVNFTPNDSKRILTGVAPSGSSKTKARREKEAMERSRRLSQAALRAVQKAGGDLEMLKVEGAWEL